MPINHFKTLKFCEQARIDIWNCILVFLSVYKSKMADGRYSKNSKFNIYPQCPRNSFHNLKIFWTNIWNYILVINQHL